MEISDEGLTEFFGALMPVMDERRRRLMAGAVSELIGQGGARKVSDITGMSETTISKARKELKGLPRDPKARPRSDDFDRTRAPGAGRKSVCETNPQASEVLELLMEGNLYSDPDSPLSWTTRSYRDLSDKMKELGAGVSHVTVGKMLAELGYSPKQRSRFSGAAVLGPDSDAQFRLVRDRTELFIGMGQPVISVEISVPEDHHPRLTEGGPCPAAAAARFTAGCIRSWWEGVGRELHPDATDVMVVTEKAVGHRRRMMSAELERLAAETGLSFHMMHLPPGTSRWNGIVNRMTFSIGRGPDVTSGTSMSAVVSTIATADGRALRSCGPSAHGVISLRCDGGWDYSVGPEA